MQNILHLSPADNKNSSTNGIQESLDKLKETGGALHLSAGTFLIKRSVNIHANISVFGDGVATVIKRPAVLNNYKAAKDIYSDDHEVILEDVSGLEIGTEICLRSEEERGWHSYHGIVLKIENNIVTLEPVRYKEGRTYKKDDFLTITNWFPAFCFQNADNAEIKNLLIDGEFKNPDKLEKTDFTNAAIHTIDSSNLLIDSITIKNWPGDGIGVQKGNCNTVTNCLIDGCCGQGMHPGTGTRNSMWTNNISKNNTQDGFFFCLNVYNCTCSNNHFLNNKRHGIGGLTKPDRFNIVSNNIISNNGKHGIEAAAAWHNIIEGNLLCNNSQAEAGKYAAILLSNHEGNIIKNNRMLDDQEKITQAIGIQSITPGPNNIIADNLELNPSK